MLEQKINTLKYIDNWNTESVLRIDASNSKFNKISLDYNIGSDSITNEQRCKLIIYVDPKVYLKTNYLYISPLGGLNISQTLTFANTNEIIYIGAGTYNETLTISKSIVLKGAKNGISGVTRDNLKRSTEIETIINFYNSIKKWK